MNSNSHFRFTNPELYTVPHVGVAPTQISLPQPQHPAPFTVEGPSERPPVGFIPSQNVDATPTLDGYVLPVDDRTIQDYHTLPPSHVHDKLNHAVGDLRPLLERETHVDEMGREVTYQYDPISGLFLHSGYAVNKNERPLHYEKTIDRGDHFLPPPILNNGASHVAHTPTTSFYLPRLQPSFH